MLASSDPEAWLRRQPATLAQEFDSKSSHIVNVTCVMVGPRQPPVNRDCEFARCVGAAVGAPLVSANKAIHDFVRALRERAQSA